MRRPSLLETLGVAACRALMRLHPAAARRRYESDMVVALRDAIRDARRRSALAAGSLVLAEMFDLAASSVAARRRDAVTATPTSHSSSGGVHVFPTWLEWRQALRRLLARPGYAAIVIGALALGIGANTVVFSVADAVLLRGAPYPNGPRLIELYNRPLQGRVFHPGVLVPAMQEWQRQKEIFEQVEGFNYASFIVTGGAEPETIGGAYVTPGLFPALDVRPTLGRLFDAEDGTPGRNRVVILSHRLWRRAFGGDPNVLGKHVILDGNSYSVIGVMPQGFRFPAAPQLLWLPGLPPGPSRNPRWQAVALLAPGVSVEAAQSRADAIATGLQASRPIPTGWGLHLMPLRGTMTNDTTRQALKILLGAVTLVLLIACANVANLFLAQAIARDREMSIRAALGASRWRLVRELLAEGMCLAVAAGAVAMAIAWWGVDAATAIAPERLTRMNATEIRFDGRALTFTTLITFATGLLFGILPALRASRPALSPALAGRTATSGRSHGRLRSVLVVGEVALSVVLLVGAALLIRSFVRLQSVDLGYDPGNLLNISVSLPADRYPLAQQREFFRNLQQAITSMPGVRGVTTGDGLPADASIHFAEIEVQGQPRDGKPLIIPGTDVAPDYFATLGIPLIAGRGFTEEDPPNSIIISQGLAAKHFPNGDAIGARLRLDERDNWKTVVGVVGEVRQAVRQAEISEFELYFPLWPRQAPVPSPPPVAPGARVTAHLFVRADEPMALVPLIKQAVWRVEPGQPVEDAALAEHTLAKAFAEQRFALTLMTVFAALALILSVAGLYAVLSQIVVQRTQEIGVRIALGAQRVDIWNLIVLRGMTLATTGVIVGVAGAFALSRYIRSQLYETSPTDPASIALVAGLMLLVALIACWMPTRRAMTVDPIAALRNP